MNTLVVYCHPDATSFTAAVRDAVVDSRRPAGHEVRVRDLYADGFEARLSAEERRNHRMPGPRPAVAGYADELRWCQHLVLVYPTWWSGQPAMLKGWIDRVWVQGVAWDLPEGASRVRARLRNIRRITAVTTHGSSKWINSLEGEGGKRTLTRSLRAMGHPLARSGWVAMYGLDTSTAAQRAAFLTAVRRKLGTRR